MCNRGRSNQRISVGRQAQGAWDNSQGAYVVEAIAGEDATLFIVVEMPERRNQHERLEAPGYDSKIYLRPARAPGDNPAQNERGVQRQGQLCLLLTRVPSLLYELGQLFPIALQSRPDVGFC
jgi:hypothetical protein